eukprot:768636-Hanusia_phi.AAC.5
MATGRSMYGGSSGMLGGGGGGLGGGGGGGGGGGLGGGGLGGGLGGGGLGGAGIYGGTSSNMPGGYGNRGGGIGGAGQRTSYDDSQVSYGRNQLGADWRVQLAEYASSRLKDEEAKAEIDRLNNALRQSQARASEDVRREQERLGAALRQTESSAEHQLRTLRDAVKRRDEEYRRMWAEAMQRRDDEYRRMWSDEKIRIQQVVDEYRRRMDQDVARLQEANVPGKIWLKTHVAAGRRRVSPEVHGRRKPSETDARSQRCSCKPYHCAAAQRHDDSPRLWEHYRPQDQHSDIKCWDDANTGSIVTRKSSIIDFK